jgi:TRAP-type C4-dicarboxylate transport system substrate-binding protein
MVANRIYLFLFSISLPLPALLLECFINSEEVFILKRSFVFWVSLLLVMVFMVLMACCTSPAVSNGEPANKDGEATQVFKLSLAHFFPASHPVEKVLLKQWTEAIEEATAGRVIITSYPGETLSKASEIYDGVVTGIADLGLSCFSYTRGRFPVTEAFELPGITYNNSKVASKVAWEGIKELDPQELKDTKLMMVLATGPGDLFTKKPIRELNDLQGVEIRATGLSAKTLEMLGAIPVAMSQPEAYESLSKGIITGNLAPVEVLQGWKHAEVTDYLTLTPFLYNTLFFITMNLETWNSLPADLQEIIEDINEEYHEKLACGLWDMQNEEALQWSVEKMGMEIFTLSEEETEKWISLLQPIQDEFVDKLEKQGLQGEDILNKVKELASYYNEIYK